jgi:hypothetical protein
MTPAEIANLNHRSRAAVAFAPTGFDGRTHYAAVFAAAAPAIGILAVAATLLLAIL